MGLLLVCHAGFALTTYLNGLKAYRIITVASWRWTYYVSLIVEVLAFLLILVFYWPPNFLGLHPEGKTRRQQFLELDFIGLLLFGGGLTVFLVGIGFGGNPYPWTGAIVLSPTIIGGISVFVAFPVWEAYSPETITKLCPPQLLRNVRAVVVPLAVSFVSGMALISTGILWPQQVQRLFTTVPSTIGWYGVATNCCATGKCNLYRLWHTADIQSRFRHHWSDVRHSS